MKDIFQLTLAENNVRCRTITCHVGFALELPINYNIFLKLLIYWIKRISCKLIWRHGGIYEKMTEIGIDQYLIFSPPFKRNKEMYSLHSINDSILYRL